MFEVNVIGTLQVTKALLLALKASRRGSSSTSAPSPAARHTRVVRGTPPLGTAWPVVETMRLEPTSRCGSPRSRRGWCAPSGPRWTRFGGDRGAGRRRVRRGGRAARRRGRRRGHRVDGDLACTRQRRPVADQAAGSRRRPTRCPASPDHRSGSRAVRRSGSPGTWTGGAHGLQVPSRETSIPMRGATRRSAQHHLGASGLSGKPSPGWNASESSPSAPSWRWPTRSGLQGCRGRRASRWPHRGGRCSAAPPASVVPSSDIVVGLVTGDVGQVQQALSAASAGSSRRPPGPRPRTPRPARPSAARGPGGKGGRPQLGGQHDRLGRHRRFRRRRPRRRRPSAPSARARPRTSCRQPTRVSGQGGPAVRDGRGGVVLCPRRSHRP